MTYQEAQSKAERLASQGEIPIIVEVEDRAHGDGEGPDRFDAVTMQVFSHDQHNGKYMREATAREAVCLNS